MNKAYLITAAVLGAASVMLGAFGAHGLKTRMNADAFDIFETAVKYQFYHVFALLVVGIISQYIPNNFLNWSGRMFYSRNHSFFRLIVFTFFLQDGRQFEHELVGCRYAFWWFVFYCRLAITGNCSYALVNLNSQ
jgi:hypothetical protein